MSVATEQAVRPVRVDVPEEISGDLRRRGAMSLFDRVHMPSLGRRPSGSTPSHSVAIAIHTPELASEREIDRVRQTTSLYRA